MWSVSAASCQRGASEGRHWPAPWRRRGLRLQAVPHCRLPTPTAFLHKYELGAQLGRGNFGTVWEATERATGCIWAAKVVAKSSNKLKMLLLSREIQVLKMVEHQNIVYLREIFETPENVYLILELCEHGELATFCQQKGKVSETDARNIISGIANAIQYLHKHGIVHRDLKLENVLLASPGGGADSPWRPCAKLSDFGLAEVKDKRDHEHMMELFCGTPYCMAPEILSERAYSQQCDVWSMGVILYTLMVGCSPYLGGSERDVLYSIHRHPHMTADPALEKVSAGARDLLNRMLLLDPAYRITAAELVTHPWITQDQCTEASASLDILTLMKTCRIEAASPDDSSSDIRAETETSAHTHQQTTELVRTSRVCGTADGGSGRSSSGRGGQHERENGRRGHGGGQNGRRRGVESGSGTLQTARSGSSRHSDQAVRPASCSAAPRGANGRGRGTPLPVWIHQSAHRLSGPSRRRSGHRPAPGSAGAGRQQAAADSPASGTVRRKSAAGVPYRHDPASTPDTWARSNRRPRTTCQRRTGAT